MSNAKSKTASTAATTDKTADKADKGQEAAQAEAVPDTYRPTSARCDGCLFGRKVIIVKRGPVDKDGNARCECHVARPTSHGFPVVRCDDWCSYHVGARTHERTFGGIITGI